MLLRFPHGPYYALVGLILAAGSHVSAWAGDTRIYYPQTVLAPADVQRTIRPMLTEYAFRLSDDPNNEYRLDLIEDGRQMDPDGNPDEERYVLGEAQRGKDATWEEFRKEMAKRYPGQFSEERIAKMMAEDRVLGPQMARLIIKDQTGRVLTTLKMTAEGDDGKGLDVEEGLGWQYPRHWRFEIPSEEDPKTHRRRALQPALEGGVVQFSGFMNRGSKNLGAVIHFAASHLALQGLPGTPEIVMTPDLKKNYSQVTRDLVAMPTTTFLHLTEAVVYCAGAQAYYYREFMGFRDLYQKGDNDFVLGLPMDEFRRIAEKNILWKKGRQLVQQYGFDSVYRDGGGTSTQHWSVDDFGFVGSWPHTPVRSTFLAMQAPALDSLVNSPGRARCREDLDP